FHVARGLRRARGGRQATCRAPSVAVRLRAPGKGLAAARRRRNAPASAAALIQQRARGNGAVRVGPAYLVGEISGAWESRTRGRASQDNNRQGDRQAESA